MYSLDRGSTTHVPRSGKSGFCGYQTRGACNHGDYSTEWRGALYSRLTQIMSEKRDSAIRVNDSDVAALKAARDSIDSSLALGAVARLGAQQLLADEKEDSGVNF